MNLDIQHDEEAQQFTALLEQEDIGELAYALPDEETIDFQHTYIEEEYRGKGYANKLIKHGLDYAASKGLEVRASCPAVARYLERNPM
ncbi:GNAT family N-acetyltransferase [Rufibacter latericius]|uniref:N-acetyltransferase n=1 Tax=Rufibacter latericius TaxID=2487040 RepID=A0A3M9N3D8_9BACT|nr:GNAT family N-acetyltransferase [Rufibacter latericius]RNI31693.1 N-acetyltransferase [Rufibacter latericius]